MSGFYLVSIIVSIRAIELDCDSLQKMPGTYEIVRL
jgi:hypothetical protein